MANHTRVHLLAVEIAKKNICEKSYIKRIWLSPNEGHLRQTNVTIHLLGRVTRIFVIKG
jgi:hypothetical protein